MRKKWKKRLKVSLLAVLFVIIYLVATLVLPPAFHPKAGAVTLPESATGERVACVDSNLDALIWRIRMIESAREEIILSTFGYGTGDSARDLNAALLAAADRGVQIRLLLDGYNGAGALKDSAELQALSAHPNVQLRLYNKLNLLTLWDANYRMHDKYLIVDREMYLLGGRNTNDLFLGNYSATPNIDRDILVVNSSMEGSAGQLVNYFHQVWSLDCCSEEDYAPSARTKMTQAQMKIHYEDMKWTYIEAFDFTNWQGETIPARGVSLLTGEIQPKVKAPTLWKKLVLSMSQGQDVLIQTPYVICGEEMYDDLSALRAGGTKVTILTNSPETGANPFGCTDLQNQRKNIVSTGANLLEYAGAHSIHAKLILIDDSISIVGSFNLDMRSAYLDTETMLMIDCPELNAQLREQMGVMAEQSLRRTPTNEEIPGPNYQPGELSFWQSVAYFLLRIFEGLFRHLL